METKICTQIGVPTLLTEILEKTNAEAVTKDLYMADELHEVTATVVRITSYQQRLTNLYNMHVKSRAFRVGRPSLKKGLRKHG